MSIILPFLLFCLLTISTSLLHPLTSSNFPSLITSSPYQLWIIMFGADWCQHCQHLKPQFQTAALQMQSYGLKFGYVNEKGNGDLVQRYVADPHTHMVSYPKVLVILGGEVLGEMPGQYRNSHAVKWWFENTFKIEKEK